MGGVVKRVARWFLAASLFFWFAAIPTGLSDVEFTNASTPIPFVALIAALGLLARRSIHRSKPASATAIAGG